MSTISRCFALLAALCSLTAPAVAEDAPPVVHTLLRPGNVVVSGFSGTRLADPTQTSATASADGITLDANGASLRILSVDTGGPTGDPLRNAREVAAYSARTLGQVFGIALNDAVDPATKTPAPNIYATASSAYGLNIVLPPATQDGWPRRTLGGDPQASWMAGQWGDGIDANGKPLAGGPGSIWRIDGTTGKITLLATIATSGKPNAAAGLGNIAYDPVSHQLFVSDLESGLIHRLSLTGEDLGTFDHGVAGRKAAGFSEVPDDPTARADIKSNQFRSDDPNTWGFAQPSRRVWGLNVSAGRLYYAVADGPEVWSVGLNSDGSFGTARREIILPQDKDPFEISDISFDSRGWIYLAQRPPVTGTSDYLFLAAEAPARVLRYKPNPATHAWDTVPDEYPVGLTKDRRQTDGGVALGYGYSPDGKLDPGTCDGTLWTTGDDLDRSPRKTAALGSTSDAPDAATGLNISGLQWSPTDPKAVAKETVRFAEFDGLEPTAPTRGHVGGVRVFKLCGNATASATPVVTEDQVTTGALPPVDLELDKIAVGDCRVGRLCRIEVKIWNRGTTRYSGPILIADALSKAGARLVDSGPSRWICGAGGTDVSCRHPGLDIEPGFSTSLYLDYRLPERWPYPEFADCVDLVWGNDPQSPQVIVALEVELARLGLYKGEVDRIKGPRLTDAIKIYQQRHGLAANGEITSELLEAIIGHGINLPPDRLRPHPKACARFTVDVPTTTTTVTYEPPPPIINVVAPPIFVTTVITPSCPIGFWDRYGTCVRTCPWGFHAFGDRCVPDGGFVCRGGWFVGGDCTCPVGFRAESGPRGVTCRPRGGPVVGCFGGLQTGGTCFCPSGTVLRGGRCVAFGGPIVRPGFGPIPGPVPGFGPGPQRPCPPGFRPFDGRCIVANRPLPLQPPLPGGPRPNDRNPQVAPVNCPPGTVRRGPTCVSVQQARPRPPQDFRPRPDRHPDVQRPMQQRPQVQRPRVERPATVRPPVQRQNVQRQDIQRPQVRSAPPPCRRLPNGQCAH